MTCAGVDIAKGRGSLEDSVVQFYDRLASDYHLVFRDWRGAVRWQGHVLDKLIRAEVVGEPISVLDCSCGIGTQAIGLALHGHRVHATDLSPISVERAAREAGSFGVSLTVGVADLRRLDTQVEGSFDVVLSCDNALAHLLSVDDLRLALRGMRSKLQTGGLLVASIRDYDRILGERPSATLPTRSEGPAGTSISFQLWDWHEDGRGYVQRLFVLSEIDGRWETTHYETVSRAILRDELSGSVQEAGFVDVRWRLPEETGFYQPIVTARKES